MKKILITFLMIIAIPVFLIGCGHRNVEYKGEKISTKYLLEKVSEDLKKENNYSLNISINDWDLTVDVDDDYYLLQSQNNDYLETVYEGTYFSFSDGILKANGNFRNFKLTIHDFIDIAKDFYKFDKIEDDLVYYSLTFKMTKYRDDSKTTKTWKENEFRVLSELSQKVNNKPGRLIEFSDEELRFESTIIINLSDNSVTLKYSDTGAFYGVVDYIEKVHNFDAVKKKEMSKEFLEKYELYVLSNTPIEFNQTIQVYTVRIGTEYTEEVEASFFEGVTATRNGEDIMHEIFIQQDATFIGFSDTGVFHSIGDYTLEYFHRAPDLSIKKIGAAIIRVTY